MLEHERSMKWFYEQCQPPEVLAEWHLILKEHEELKLVWTPDLFSELATVASAR